MTVKFDCVKGLELIIFSSPNRMTSLKAEHAQVEQNLKNLKERFSPRLPMGSDTRHPSFKR